VARKGRPQQREPQRRNLLFLFVVAAALTVACCAQSPPESFFTLGSSMSQPPGRYPKHARAPTTSRNSPQLHDLPFTVLLLYSNFLPMRSGLAHSIVIIITRVKASRARERQKRSCSFVDYYGRFINSAPRHFFPALRFPLLAAAPPPRHSQSPRPPHRHRRSIAPSPVVRRAVTSTRSAAAAAVACPLDRCARP
jgi:hypothetical protein